MLLTKQLLNKSYLNLNNIINKIGWVSMGAYHTTYDKKIFREEHIIKNVWHEMQNQRRWPNNIVSFASYSIEKNYQNVFYHVTVYLIIKY